MEIRWRKGRTKKETAIWKWDEEKKEWRQQLQKESLKKKEREKIVWMKTREGEERWIKKNKEKKKGNNEEKNKLR